MCYETLMVHCSAETYLSGYWNWSKQICFQVQQVLAEVSMDQVYHCWKKCVHVPNIFFCMLFSWWECQQLVFVGINLFFVVGLCLIPHNACNVSVYEPWTAMHLGTCYVNTWSVGVLLILLVSVYESLHCFYSTDPRHSITQFTLLCNPSF